MGKKVLVVRRLSDHSEVSRVEVDKPYSIIRGMFKYQVVMSGMLRNLNDAYWIDDSALSDEIPEGED